MMFPFSENNAIFFGIVENNIDPTNSGRIQVRCFGVHPAYSTSQVATEDLPWAFVISNGKMFSIPDNGDWVMGIFLDGRDAQHPIIFGVVNTVKYSTPFTGQVSYPGSSSIINSAGNTQAAYQYFISQGFTPEQSAGIVGNLLAESNLDPKAYNPAGGGNGAQGIAQWRGSRIAQFEKVYGKKLLEASLEEQLQFVSYEMRTSEQAAYRSLKLANTSGQAAEIFDRLFERSGGGSVNKRIGLADQVFSTFSNPSQITAGDSYFAPSQDSIRNYGSLGLPPQMTGEDLELTPHATASLLAQNNEPSMPISGSVDSTVWQTRYGGTAIELSGKNGSDEFVNIMHPSGAFVSIDPRGSVSIRSAGNSYRMADGSVFDGSQGSHNIQADEGYNITVTNGGISIQSTGDIAIESQGNMSLKSSGKIGIHAGESLSLTGASVYVQSNVDGLDFKSSTYIASTSSTGHHLNDSAIISLISSGPVAADGSEIYLNSGRSVDVPAVSLPKEKIKEKAVVTAPIKSTPIPLSSNMTDDIQA